jgi:hypothetical protein
VPLQVLLVAVLVVDHMIKLTVFIGHIEYHDAFEEGAVESLEEWLADQRGVPAGTPSWLCVGDVHLAAVHRG